MNLVNSELVELGFLEILRVLVSMVSKLASNSVVSFVVLLVLPVLNMKVSLALFLAGGSRLFSLYLEN